MSERDFRGLSESDASTVVILHVTGEDREWISRLQNRKTNVELKDEWGRGRELMKSTDVAAEGADAKDWNNRIMRTC